MKEISRIEKCNLEEVKMAIEAIYEVDNTINVLDKKVAPYGYYIPMREIVDRDITSDFNNYSTSSQRIFVDELNGCIDFVNQRIRIYNENDVTIRFLVGKQKGKTKVLKESVAKDFVEMKLAVIV